LLIRLGVPFIVDPADTVERVPRPGEDPAAYALAIARRKADDGFRRHPDATVLAADTVVTVDGLVLGKPRDEQHALEMLQLLRGRCHHVITAVTIRCGVIDRGDTIRSEVCMEWVNDGDLLTYIATGEPMDKAGSYALQGRGGRLVANISGCYNNIVGLPLCLSSQLLVACGVLVEIPEKIDVHSPAEWSERQRS
jgi:septum formation protein